MSLFLNKLFNWHLYSDHNDLSLKNLHHEFKGKICTFKFDVPYTDY